MHYHFTSFLDLSLGHHICCFDFIFLRKPDGNWFPAELKASDIVTFVKYHNSKPKYAKESLVEIHNIPLPKLDDLNTYYA